MLLRLPLIGRLIRDLHAARMARTLSTMVASRLPLLEGLRLTTETVHNRVAARGLGRHRRGGPHRRQPVGRAAQAGVFPPLLVSLAASGEASGKLDLMLERAADYLEREFDAFTSTALALLEPAIIIVMGVIVARDRAVDPASDPATRHARREDIDEVENVRAGAAIRANAGRGARKASRSSS